MEFHPLPASSGNINLQMIDPLKGYYISGKIYSTQDGGNTWKTINPVSWSGQPDFIDFNHGWAVARNGEQIALVQTTNGGGELGYVDNDNNPIATIVEFAQPGSGCAFC